MFSAAQRLRLSATFQRNAEAMCPHVLVLNGRTIPCSGGAWRGVANSSGDRDTLTEIRTCAIRVLKSEIAASGATMGPGTVSATLDDMEVTLEEQGGETNSDVAFRFEARAVAPDEAQS